MSNAVNFRPILDRILVRREVPESKRGSIFIPETVRKKACFGEILATGPGVRDEDGNRVPLHVKPGDRIIFDPEWVGVGIRDEGVFRTDNLLVMKEEDVLAVGV